MNDYTLISEACKIAQALDGVQNLSAVGIGNYLRKCSPEVVLGLIEANAKLENEVQRITELRRVEWSNSVQATAENRALRKALAECASSLEGEMLQKYFGQDPEAMHPVTRREYDRDMAEVNGYKAFGDKPRSPVLPPVVTLTFDPPLACDMSAVRRALRNSGGRP